jgi:hypothetical protein
VKARGAALQGAIAAGALALAAVTWLRGPDTNTPASVTVVDLPAGTVQRVVWDDGSHLVEVQRLPSGGTGVSVRIARSPSLLPVDAGADGGARPGPLVDAGAPTWKPDAGTRADGGVSAIDIAPPAPDRELLGNETAEKLLDSFSPFTAARTLGTPDAAKMRELGLEGGPRHLEVWTSSKHLVFAVSTPVGTGASYLRTEDGRVFVLGGSLIQDLTAAASRLVDRRVHAFRQDEADHIVVHLGSQSRALVQRRVGGVTKVMSEGHAEVPDVYAQAWLDRLGKMAPSDVLGRGEVPTEGEPHIELRVDFQRNAQTLGFVELARAQNAWFARSEHSVGWMRVVGRAEGLMHDAERLVATP